MFAIIDTESGHSSSSRLVESAVGLDTHVRINSTPTRELGGSIIVTHKRSSLYSEDSEEVVSSSSNGAPRKLLMFHGLILRSQLTVLLKHKAFFDENDGVSENKLVSFV